ncbi:MAG TPA: D-arabinono-1,4-lactone oxidase [Enhygromyxa sp.]|nr:D-arabinono-1,4-lactone oxidase [Enhygromyxa sp.]
MKLEQLRQHPAYLALTPDERAAVDERLQARHLDAPAVAATTGEMAELDVGDLRFWLASTKQRPWTMITLGEQPERANAMFEAMLASAPELSEHPDRAELVDMARDLCRAFVVAAGTRFAAGFIREEQLAALHAQLDALHERVAIWKPEAVLELAAEAGLADVSKAVREHLRQTTGLRGFFDRLGDRMRTKVFDVVHGGLYIATGDSEHEGRERDGEWRNWSADLVVRPQHFLYPASEEELSEMVSKAERLVRVVGGGHSFNAGAWSDDTMISLDDYDRILELNVAAKTVRVQAGIRLRDLCEALWDAKLGFPLLGSTDTQSVGGVIASDLHGSGRDHGFMSEQLLSLRVVAADGTARTVERGDPLFHAAIGGIGCCGVVTEAEFALVDAYHIAMASTMVDRKQTEADLDALLQAHEHLSFYYVSGSDQGEAIRMHTWNRSTAPISEHWEQHKLRSELADFAVSAFFPNVAELLADVDEDAWLSNVLLPDHGLVMPCSRGFGRQLFYRHDEIEFGVPFERHRECLEEVLALLKQRNFFSVIELRFTPDQSQALLGPGVGRRTAFIELATPLAQQRGEIYALVETILRRHGGQPHLGKKTNMIAQDMFETYGERFSQFQEIRGQQDPNGKFLNPFCRQLFGAV